MDDSFFAEFLGKSEKNGVTAELVLLVDGACITGLLSSDKHFTEQTNATIGSLGGTASDEVDPSQLQKLRLEGPLNQSEDHINLREAKVLSGIGERLLPVVRIDLRRVSGWGVVERAPEDDVDPGD